MTMNELHALYDQYFPSAPPPAQQGRAGVTALRIDDDHGSTVTLGRFRKPRLCACGCGQEFERWSGQRRKYVNDAHKQAAYRQRKKAAK